MDGTPVDYTLWADGSPFDYDGTHCVVVLSSSTQDAPDVGHWNNTYCHFARAFVCKMPKSKSFLQLYVLYINDFIYIYSTFIIYKSEIIFLNKEK